MEVNSELLERLSCEQQDRMLRGEKITQIIFKESVETLLEIGIQQPNLKLDNFSVSLVRYAVNNLGGVEPDLELFY